MADWDQIHDAVHEAIVEASGLTQTRVIWKWQNADAPPLDYVTLGFGGMATKGLDSIQQTYDASRPQGKEFELRVIGVREMPLEVECFTATTADRHSALSLAERIRTSLLLPSVRGRFAAVEVSPFDPGTVNYVPDIASVKFRGRAHFTVRCYLPAPRAVEYATYIASVSGTETIEGARNGELVRPWSAP